MPINNPAPAIRPPTARQMLEQDEQRANMTIMPPPTAPATAPASAPAPTAAPTTAPRGVSGPQAPVAPPAASGGVAGDMMRSYGGATPAGGSGLNQDLTGLARGATAAPGRYDLPLVQQSIDLIDQDLNAAREDSLSSIDEFNSMRGRVGSSFERQDRQSLEGDLNRQRMERLVDLQERMAQTVMQDRKTAADIGTQVGQFGLDQQTVDLRAQELMQSAQLEGRSLDLQEARLLAENEQFGQNLAQRQHEFAQNMGLSQQQFAAQQRQFSAQMAEQVASRLQQGSQFAASLASDEARFAMQFGLEERALQLQQEGMQMDEAFRRAELEMETGLRNRALELEEAGMSLDEAYRRAALEQQNDLARAGLDLDRQGLNLERDRLDQTGRLSELDIILRAIASGEVDATQLQDQLNRLGGGGKPDGAVDQGWKAGNPAPTQTGGGGLTDEQLSTLLAQIQQMSSGG